VVGNHPPTHSCGELIEGYETIGALHFPEFELAPGEARTFILLLAILEPDCEPGRLVEKYGSLAQFEAALQANQDHWNGLLDTTRVTTGLGSFDGWMRWVSVQPTLRRLFGNSFLPYHDYGRGGRGWRDLWQDILALLLMETGDVRGTLAGHFAGIRIDGSNATIIGSRPGEFKADRNNIPRTWMDHGAWPWLTTRLYIERSGDLQFLLLPQTFFKDHLTHRAKKIDSAWNPVDGTFLQTSNGSTYHGTILEHLLVQHLAAFFNVGEHNNIRLEDADWNDGLDMAPEKGESVAFTALYASNLRELAEYVLKLEETGVQEVALAEELYVLLDTLGDQPIDYNIPAERQAVLDRYFNQVCSTISGQQLQLPLERLAADLQAKADWFFTHLRTNEWIENAEGHGWFNGYYENAGQRLEGDHPDGLRMTLTGQVFTLMGGVATQEQADRIVQAVKTYLYDQTVGGIRLNTPFEAVMPRFGRAFGFAYGHKENGAMFSHMALMYAYALYERGYAREGFQVMNEIFRHSQNFAVSRMYPGIAEYINNRGRGMYPFLTGSASWYLLTLVTQAFGIQGEMGTLVLKPRLVKEQFTRDGIAQIQALFAGKQLLITYLNPENLDAGGYSIGSVRINGQLLPSNGPSTQAAIPRALIDQQDGGAICQVDVTLIR
jgi:cellobiose phosphorylase